MTQKCQFNLLHINVYPDVWQFKTSTIKIISSITNQQYRRCPYRLKLIISNVNLLYSILEYYACSNCDKSSNILWFRHSHQGQVRGNDASKIKWRTFYTITIKYQKNNYYILEYCALTSYPTNTF